MNTKEFRIPSHKLEVYLYSNMGMSMNTGKFMSEYIFVDMDRDIHNYICFDSDVDKYMCVCLYMNMNMNMNMN